MSCYALGVITIDLDHVSRRRAYDPRVRELVCATGNPDMFPELNIPKSTLRGWLSRVVVEGIFGSNLTTFQPLKSPSGRAKLVIVEASRGSRVHHFGIATKEEWTFTQAHRGTLRQVDSRNQAARLSPTIGK